MLRQLAYKKIKHWVTASRKVPAFSEVRYMCGSATDTNTRAMLLNPRYKPLQYIPILLARTSQNKTLQSLLLARSDVVTIKYGDKL